MKNLSKFQLVTLGIFSGFIVIALIIFSIGKTSSTEPILDVLVWGTMPKSEFTEMLKGSKLDQNETLKINYIQKEVEGFDNDLLEALVSGTAPDLFFLSSDSILKLQDRVYPISFKSYSERDFKNAFIEGAEIFLTENSILGLPVSIDPMVMYWNRDIFQSAGYVKPPQFWDEMYNLVPALSIKNNSSVIERSAVALGEYVNVSNAFEILSTLIMQSGNPIVEKNSAGFVSSVLTERYNFPVPPTESALSFYTEFSNPLRLFYSWNRSLPWSKNHFISGDLAIYFGPASELFEIRDKNPNLNFDVAYMPQAQEAEKNITYGKVEALALNKQSRKLAGALEVAKILSGPNAVLALSQARSLPPVRRDLLALNPERDYLEIFYDSAIIARPWLVPDKTQAGQIFRNMVESVISGRYRSSEAVKRADVELRELIKDINE